MDDRWDELFDELYLATYATALEQRDSDAEALGAARLAALEPGADILDAPCGFGRHSLSLARAGYRVVGVDRSEVQLDEARARSGGADWPRFVRADFRELPFEPASFDGVLCLITSIGYRGEAGDRAMLAEFRRVLRPGGALVVETMHRDRLTRVFEARGWEPLRDGDILFEERRWDAERGVNAVTHTLLRASGERLAVPYELRVYAATELVALVRAAGFADVSVYGGWEGEPLTLDSRLLLVARAPH